MNQLTTFSGVLLLGLSAIACEKNDTVDPGDSEVGPGYDANVGAPVSAKELGPVDEKPGAEVDEAEAELLTLEGSKMEGEAEFKMVANGVSVVLELEDAVPGPHGVHIHEVGDCSDIPGKSMGGHFNPAKSDHALPDEEAKKHLGDLGNIEVGPDGEGELKITVEGATLKEGAPNSFLGRALVVHGGMDSGSAKQPSGGSGDPVACGVVKSD